MFPPKSVDISFTKYQKFNPEAIKELCCEMSYPTSVLGRPATIFHLALGSRLHDVCSLDNIQNYVSDMVPGATTIHFKFHALKTEARIVVPNKNPEDIKCRSSFANLHLADAIIRYFTDPKFTDKETVISFRNSVHPMRWRQIKVACGIFQEVSKGV